MKEWRLHSRTGNKLNSNIGCFEILSFWTDNKVEDELNSNIGCFEIEQSSKNKNRNVKQ